MSAEDYWPRIPASVDTAVVQSAQVVFAADSASGVLAVLCMVDQFPQVSVADIAALRDQDIDATVPIGAAAYEVELAPAVAEVVADGTAVPPILHEPAVPAVMHRATAAILVRIRRWRDACKVSVTQPAPGGGAGTVATAPGDPGLSFSKELVSALTSLGTAAARDAHQVPCPPLPAGFEALPGVLAPPKAVLQKWADKCAQSVTGRARTAGTPALPFFPGEVELTRCVLPSFAPRDMQKAADAKNERDRMRASFAASPFVPDAEAFAAAAAFEEEQCGGFPLFAVMLWRWGLAVASLRLTDPEIRTDSMLRRATVMDACQSPCPQCAPVGSRNASRIAPARFFDLGEFFMYFATVCELATRATATHAIEYDRRMRRSWDTRVAQGENLDWRVECEEVRTREWEAVLALRPLPVRGQAKAVQGARTDSDAGFTQPTAKKRAPGVPAAKAAPPPPPARKGKASRKGAPPAPAPQGGKGSGKACWHYHHGTCYFGDRCKDSHDPSLPPPTEYSPAGPAGAPPAKGKGKAW